MDLHISAVTKAQDGELSKDDLKEMIVHCGVNAGISQCRETFLDGQVKDRKKAEKRFHGCIKRGHMSVADHAMVEVVFEKASRMMAMVMNSLQFNATTEKSGRYTEMEGDDKKQQALYDKWNAIFKKRVLEEYPDYNDKFIEKELAKRGCRCSVANGVSDAPDGMMEEVMALPNLPSNTRSQENARYVLSIFTKSTAFGYTTSLAQWNYIYDWCRRYIGQFVRSTDGVLRRMEEGRGWRAATLFEARLLEDFKELSEFIHKYLYVENLRDHKKRCFSMLTQIAEPGHPLAGYAPEDEHFGFSYCTAYEGSFILLSHLHRHRTITYWMDMGQQLGFYIPKPIRGTEYEDEWLKDLESIKSEYPQATLVRIIEAGTLDDFVLKTSERLCGCAMLETMENVRDTAMKFVRAAKDGGTPLMESYVSQFYDFGKGRLKTKDLITDGCIEGCYFGCGRAIDRNV